MREENTAIESLLAAQYDQVLRDWLSEVASTGDQAAGRGGATTSSTEANEVLMALRAGAKADGDPERFDDPAWNGVRDALLVISRDRAAKGASAGETNHFILSLKKPLFLGLQQQFTKDPARLVGMLWRVSMLVDRMAQHTVAEYQRMREDVIARQQQELLELSTPVVKLWDSVLAVPMIGTLSSTRTQLVLESLLQRIVDTGSQLAIIDITGVPTVDTLVAQHLLKSVTAIRLMGADCIISGVRPQIAQTIVHLGVDLRDIVTKATLADAFAVALQRRGLKVVRHAAAGAGAGKVQA
jgi:rsbT co-antagonist protein RsbR